MTAVAEEGWVRPVLRAGLAVFIVAVVLAMYPYTGDPTGHIKELVTCLAACILTGVWLVGTAIEGRSVQRPRLLFEILLGFLLLGLVASLCSSCVGQSLAELRKFVALALIYAVASHAYRTPEQVGRFMAVVCVAVGLAAVYAFVQYMGLDPFPWANRETPDYTQLPATFGHPNYAAHTIVLTILMAVYLGTRKKTAWCLGILAILLLHLYKTDQRGGAVGMTVALTLLGVALAARRKFRRPDTAAAATLLVVGLLGVGGIVGLMLLFNARTGSALPNDHPVLSRYHWYYSAARMVLERPFLGFGPGVYEIENPRFWTPFEQRWFADKTMMNKHVHNDPIEIAIDAGIPAAGLYLTFLIMAIFWALRMAFAEADPLKRRLGFTLAAFFAVFMVDGFFGFNLRVPVSAALLFVMAGALEGVSMGPEEAPEHRGAGRGVAWLWRGAVVVLSLGAAVFGMRIFVAEALFQKGRAYVAAERYDEAAQFLKRAERLAPWNWLFARQLGLVDIARGDVTAAVQDLERALTLNPYYVPTLVPLAHAEMRLGLTAPGSQSPESDPSRAEALNDAVEYANQTIALCPMLPAPEEVLGRVALAKAMQQAKTSAAAQDAPWNEAALHLERAIENGATDKSQLLMLLARARLGINDNAGAERALMCAVEADPANEAAWAFFFDFTVKTGRRDGFDRAIRKEIAVPSGTLFLNGDAMGRMYLWLAKFEQSGTPNPEAAAHAYRNAVRFAPTNPRVWSDFAQFTEMTGRINEFRARLLDTETQLRGAGHQVPPAIEAVVTAWERGPLGLAEAAAELVKAIEARPSDGTQLPAWVEFGWAADLLRSEVERTGEALPDKGPTLLNLGTAMSEIGAFDAAAAVLAAAMPHLDSPRQSVCVRRQAVALLRLGRSDEALQCLHDAIARNPDDIEVRFALAKTLKSAGHAAEARSEYQAVLRHPQLPEKARAQIGRELRALD